MTISQSPCTRIIKTATDSEEVVSILCETLLDKKLAACIQVHEVKSHYHWNDKQVSETECVLTIKTSKKNELACIHVIQELHNYEVPEIVVFVPEAVNTAYDEWVQKECVN